MVGGGRGAGGGGWTAGAVSAGGREWWDGKGSGTIRRSAQAAWVSASWGAPPAAATFTVQHLPTPPTRCHAPPPPGLRASTLGIFFLSDIVRGHWLDFR